MQYIFDYEETRVKTFKIEADNFLDACAQVKELLNQNEDIVSLEDFLCAKLIVPCEDNQFIVEQAGQETNRKDLDIIIEQW